MVDATHVPKARLVLAIAALFLSSMCTMGDLVISPIVADVYKAFADAPLWLVNLGITGPALVGLPFGLLTGYLCDRADKRFIMIAGFEVFTVSAVFGMVIENVYYFVAMRLLATGVGWGITNTAAFAILADLFTDDNQHAKYVGWYNSVMSVLGAVLASLAGFLALGGWTHAYATYWLAVPVLVMLIVFLPHFPPRADTVERIESVHGKSRSSAAALVRGLVAVQEGAPKEPGWWRRLVPLAIQVFFVACLYFIILYLIGVYVSDKGLGDEAFVGMLTSIMTLATAAGSIIFGAVYAKLGNRVYLPALAAIGAVFFVLAFTDSQVVAMVALAVAGFAWPFYFCFFYTHCTELVPEDKKGVSTSIVAAANGLAVTACSHVLTGAMAATGGTCTDVYPLFGTIMLVVLAVSVVWKARVGVRVAG